MPCLVEGVFSLMLVPSASLDEVTETDKGKEIFFCGKEAKMKKREGEQEQDAGRSRSHGGPQDLVVEVAHFP